MPEPSKVYVRLDKEVEALRKQANENDRRDYDGYDIMIAHTVGLRLAADFLAARSDLGSEVVGVFRTDQDQEGMVYKWRIMPPEPGSYFIIHSDD